LKENPKKKKKKKKKKNNNIIINIIFKSKQNFKEHFKVVVQIANFT
jgi:hypothetical protein